MKILIIQEWIPHYRLALFNAMGKNEKVELTVAYDLEKGFTTPARELFFTPVGYRIKKTHKFRWIPNLKTLVKGYDRIVMVGDLHFLPTHLLLIKNNRKRVFFWGIGISSDNGIQKKPILDLIRFFLNDFTLGTILYSDVISDYYKLKVKNKEKVFSLPNTIKVKQFPFSYKERKDLIVMGSFKAVKKIDNVILAFNNIVSEIPSNFRLHLIGDGPEEKNLKELVKNLSLNERVIFHGRIQNDTELFPIISTCVVCVSPAQAGLSVLHSMAFGCPFLTSEAAITGGEKYNIMDKINSYFYDGTIKSLEDKLLWIIKNPSKNLEIAENAYNYYHSKRTIDDYSNSYLKILKGNEH